jgi:hypothetical protein
MQTRRRVATREEKVMDATRFLMVGSLPLAVACSAPPSDPGGWSTGPFDGTDGGTNGADDGAASGGNVSGSGTNASNGSASSGSGSTSGSGSSGNASGGGGFVNPSYDAGPGLAEGGAVPKLATIQTVDIPVPAGAELVKCQNFQNPIGQDVALLETDSTMVSSHHMFVFHDTSFNANTNSVSDCSGIEFHDLLHMAQTPTQVIQYPPDVGRSLKANEGLRVLIHLLNPTAQALTAHVTFNMQYVPPDAVQSLAVALFLNNAVLSVPPGVSTQSRTFTVPADIKVMLAVSHMHSRATNFLAQTNTGTVIYKGTSWNEPTPTRFNPDLGISAGTIITWACTYDNMTGTTLTFGESANTNEMCILAGAAYPATPGVMLGTSLESVL